MLNRYPDIRYRQLHRGNLTEWIDVQIMYFDVTYCNKVIYL